MQLESTYFIIKLKGILDHMEYANLKRHNSYRKEAIYVIYGLKEDNTRELLLLEVNPT
jgi:hypothetical protein